MYRWSKIEEKNCSAVENTLKSYKASDEDELDRKLAGKLLKLFWLELGKDKIDQKYLYQLKEALMSEDYDTASALQKWHRN